MSPLPCVLFPIPGHFRICLSTHWIPLHNLLGHLFFWGRETLIFFLWNWLKQQSSWTDWRISTPAKAYGVGHVSKIDCILTQLLSLLITISLSNNSRNDVFIIWRYIFTTTLQDDWISHLAAFYIWTYADWVKDTVWKQGRKQKDVTFSPEAFPFRQCSAENRRGHHGCARGHAAALHRWSMGTAALQKIKKSSTYSKW